MLKVGTSKGTLKIINNKNNEYLYNDNGRKILISQTNSTGAMPTNEAVQLPAGRYFLKSDGDLVTVKTFDIKTGEKVVLDFQKHVGSLRIINTAENQYLFDRGRQANLIRPGTRRQIEHGRRAARQAAGPASGALSPEKPQSPPRCVEPFDIKAGKETVIDFGG